MLALVNACRLCVAVAIIMLTLHIAPAVAQTTLSFDSALQKASGITPDTARLHALRDLRRFPGITTRQAVKLANLVIPLATTLHKDTILMFTHESLGNNYTTLNDFPAALKSFLAEISIAERLNDFESQAIANQGISWIYKTTGETYNTPGDINKSNEYLLKALDISRTHHLPDREARVLSNLAINYDIQKLHAKALETFKDAIVRADSVKDGLSLKASLWLNMAISLKNNKEYGASLAAYQKAKQIGDSMGSDIVKCYVTGNMANLYFEMQQLPVSEAMALNALQMTAAIPEELDALKTDMYTLLKKIYEQEQKYKEAYTYSTLLTNLKDSMFNREKSLQLKDMQEKYDADNKDKQIVTQQVQIDYNKKLNIILGGVGFAILLIAGFIYYNLRKTARLNRTVSLQRDELAKQSESLSVMMKELHHRVKNNLQIVSSLLNLQSMRLTDEGAISAVQESKQRVQAMSLIHQRLYKTNDITRINMREYIKELADFLATSYGYGPDNFTLELNTEEEWVDIDKALPLGLILNELLTNAFKYAFTGIEHPTLKINFKKAGGNFTLEIKDNGKGIKPGEWDDKRNTSFGRQLVKALCNQLRAKEQLEVAGGTSFTFIIPEAA